MARNFIPNTPVNAAMSTLKDTMLSTVGYGYNFKSRYPRNMKEAEKDIQTPELSRLEKLIASMGA
jgi:hypothetical protein